MEKSLEIESKCLLTENEYLVLLDSFNGEKYSQTNYYFDTEDFELKRNGFSLRIRTKNNYAEATVKEDTLEGKIETNFNISFGEVEDILNGKKALFSVISTAIPKYFAQKPLVLKGSLTTERIDLPYKNGLLSLDKNYYRNIIDYEIEYESESKEKAVQILSDFLKEKGVNSPLSNKSKVARALNL